jgi:hypothetical protein
VSDHATRITEAKLEIHGVDRSECPREELWRHAVTALYVLDNRRRERQLRVPQSPGRRRVLERSPEAVLADASTPSAPSVANLCCTLTPAQAIRTAPELPFRALGS